MDIGVDAADRDALGGGLPLCGCLTLSSCLPFAKSSLLCADAGPDVYAVQLSRVAPAQLVALFGGIRRGHRNSLSCQCG